MPEDISIVTLVDHDINPKQHLFPSTTLGRPHEQLGKTAAKMLVSLMNDPGAKIRSRVFKPKLLIGKTTAPPRKQRAQ